MERHASLRKPMMMTGGIKQDSRVKRGKIAIITGMGPTISLITTMGMTVTTSVIGIPIMGNTARDPIFIGLRKVSVFTGVAIITTAIIIKNIMDIS
jgi:hypothetical protein